TLDRYIARLRPRRRVTEHFSSDKLSEHTIAFPLLVVEELVRGRLLRKERIVRLLIGDINRLAAKNARLQQQEPAFYRGSVCIANASQGRISAAVAFNIGELSQSFHVDPVSHPTRHVR